MAGRPGKRLAISQALAGSGNSAAEFGDGGRRVDCGEIGIDGEGVWDGGPSVEQGRAVENSERGSHGSTGAVGILSALKGEMKRAPQVSLPANEDEKDEGEVHHAVGKIRMSEEVANAANAVGIAFCESSLTGLVEHLAKHA